MALIQCPQCGKQISDTAPRCPHCGTSFTKNAGGYSRRKNTLSKKRSKQRLVIAILVIVIISAIYGISVFKTIKDATSEVSNLASEIIQDYGLHLNKVTLKPKKYMGMLYYYADYRLSGFGNLKEQEMLMCAKALNDLKAKGKFIFLEHIFSEDDTYDFYISSNVIKKNGSTIFDDYFHSESYYDVQNNKQSKQSSYGGADRSRDAWVCAIEYVKNNLKSPSTAKFCKYTDATVMRVGEDEYIIHGYVDAQNTMGATVRQVWTVSLFLTEKGFREPYLEWS